MTDPSGYFGLGDVVGFISPSTKVWMDMSPEDRRTSVVIAVVVVTAGAATSAGVPAGAAGMAAGFAGGFTAAALNGANFNQAFDAGIVGGVSGGLSAAMFGLAGDGAANGTYDKYSWGHYTAHAAAGCVSSVAMQGQCGAGAATGWVGLGAEQGMSYYQIQSMAARTAVIATVGGTASRLAGGEFRNGAVTAAFGYLFNCVAHKCSSTDYDPNDKNYHAYGPFASDVTCNVSTSGCLEATRTEMACNSAPGQSGCTSVGEEKNYNLTGVTSPNPITQYRPNADTIINGTSPGHFLQDGYVVRWLGVDAAGDVRIWTAGVGVNQGPVSQALNQYGGEWIFQRKGAENVENVQKNLKSGS